jgi:2-polyprenyl-6-methoxyphenol hydroxylase-like FAD-dependent oxidoreductase
MADHYHRLRPPTAPTNVTLLGDAIHTMTPLQGIGGDTALLDAVLLCRKLVEVDRGQTELLLAIGQGEAEMRDYACKAARASLQTAQNAVSDTVVLRSVFRQFCVLPMLFRRSNSECSVAQSGSTRSHPSAN